MAGKIYCTWLKMKSCVTMSGKFDKKENKIIKFRGM